MYIKKKEKKAKITILQIDEENFKIWNLFYVKSRAFKINPSIYTYP